MMRSDSASASFLTCVVADVVVWVDVSNLVALQHELVPRGAVPRVVEHVEQSMSRHVGEIGLHLKE